ncbi:hypothetical protein EHP00_613 [Ecytonucleospora hepatopenaei]|uniref:Uncharacterized protein n=1 Tax=Ecytonucleospora hepatopenaei TaxID=646526 RepID=A0A1W0E7N3_9MICR|nr:hypothetical protein EHP00_613 [Ecytonucleospora hepatopenaei]
MLFVFLKISLFWVDGFICTEHKATSDYSLENINYEGMFDFEKNKMYNCLFKSFDLEGAYDLCKKELSKEEMVFDPFVFWFLRRFLHRKLDAFVYLGNFLAEKKCDEITKLFACRISSEGMYLYKDGIFNNKMTHKYGLDVSKSISNQFLICKYNFREVGLLKENPLKEEYSKKDILLMLESKNSSIIEMFFNLIDTSQFSVFKAQPYLLKFAKIDARCYRILGDLAWCKFLKNPQENESYIDTAMDMYWAGCEAKDADCMVGLARIFYEIYDDKASAKEYLHKTLRIKNIVEANYLLGFITGEKKSSGKEYFAKSAIKGYIPAMYVYFKTIDKQASEQNLKSILSILKFHPFIMQLNILSEKSYKTKNVIKTFLVNLFLCELNIDNARKNIIFLYENHRDELRELDKKFDKFSFLKENFNNKTKKSDNLLDSYNSFNFKNKSWVDVIYYDTVVFQEKTSRNIFSGHNKKILNKLGLCYLNGIGTEKNYVKAYSCFKAAGTDNMEARYYEAELIRNGQGVMKNQELALEMIDYQTFGSRPFLFYAFKIRFFIKTLGRKMLIENCTKLLVGFLTLIIMKISMRLNL